MSSAAPEEAGRVRAGPSTLENLGWVRPHKPCADRTHPRSPCLLQASRWNSPRHSQAKPELGWAALAPASDGHTLEKKN